MTQIRPRFMYFGLLLALPLLASSVRIIQTNSAGDDVSIIDPATNKVVGTIHGIEVNHGAASAPMEAVTTSVMRPKARWMWWTRRL